MKKRLAKDFIASGITYLFSSFGVIILLLIFIFIFSIQMVLKKYQLIY